LGVARRRRSFLLNHITHPSMVKRIPQIAYLTHNHNHLPGLVLRRHPKHNTFRIVILNVVKDPCICLCRWFFFCIALGRHKPQYFNDIKNKFANSSAKPHVKPHIPTTQSKQTTSPLQKSFLQFTTIK
jgi:hypothetical protein